MSTEQYWRHQLAQTEAEYEQAIKGLRDEVEKQRNRCSELIHEQAMQRATAAADIRDFCVQYVAESKQQQQHRHQNPGAPTKVISPSAPAYHARFNSSINVDSIPLPALLGFLHEYSHGLLQMPENRRKRERPDTALSPLHHRLRQRMLARTRMTGREDNVLLDEPDQQQQQQESVSLPMSPPLGPCNGAPASRPRFTNAVYHSSNAAEVSNTVTNIGTRNRSERHYSGATGFHASSFGAVGVERTSTVCVDDAVRGNGSDGRGGPLVAASTLGLPALPPR